LAIVTAPFSIFKHGDGDVRAGERAGTARRTLRRVYAFRGVEALLVDNCLGQSQDLFRAGADAKSATLADIRFNLDMWHLGSPLYYILLMLTAQNARIAARVNI
jgi:hypothetical protein